MAKTEFKTIAQNKKAYHDYFVEETLEAGIELCGTERADMAARDAQRDIQRALKEKNR